MGASVPRDAPVEALGLADHDHFSTLEELAAPDGALTAQIRRLAMV